MIHIIITTGVNIYMKTFKQYITESISHHIDQIKSVLVAGAQEHGFDPKDFQSHRSRGTHHKLLRAEGPFDTHISHQELRKSADTDDGMITHYKFDIPGLDKKHNPRVELRILTSDDNPYEQNHEIDFKFGDMFGFHPTLEPHERLDSMNKVFSGVLRSLVHFSVRNNVNPGRTDSFTYDAFSGALGDQPLKTSSGKERKITPRDQKQRLYNQMMDSLVHLHRQLRR